MVKAARVLGVRALATMVEYGHGPGGASSHVSDCLGLLLVMTLMMV
jgi:hypothetical protein